MLCLRHAEKDARLKARAPTHKNKSIRHLDNQPHTHPMRIVARPVIDTTPLETHRVSMRDWLVSLIAALIEALSKTWACGLFENAKRDIDAELRQTVRELRMLLVAHAFARLRPPKLSTGPSRAHLRARRVTHGAFIRKCTSPVLKHLHCGSIQDRSERLRHMIDNLDALIDAVFAHMSRMFARPRVSDPQIPIAPAAPLIAAPSFARLRADTS